MRLRASNRTLIGIVASLGATGAVAQKAPVKAARTPDAFVLPAPPKPTIDGDPGAWVPIDAYPAEALKAGAQGRVGFLLNVDPTGRVSGCRVTASSGTPVLDEATCQLVTANARFKPPRDAAGAPISSTFASAVRWALPAPVEAPAPAP